MSRDRGTARGEERPGFADEDFASRWSRLKRGPKTEPEALEARRAPVAEDSRSDEEILRELGLPDPETLKPGDDIKGFMASVVPARIRNRVLRRLWISNPVLANLDGLVDYGEDFTDAAMVPAVLQTAYKVGRGWARDAVEEEPAATSEDGDPPATEEEPGNADGETPEPGPEPAADEPGLEAAESAGADPEAEQGGRRRSIETARRPTVRRMRFRFADD